MVNVRKRGKVYEYRIEIASIDGTRKWITKSGFKTKQEALQVGAIAYNEYYQIGKIRKNKDMSYSDYLDYWVDTYCNFNLKYSTIVTYLNIIKLYFFIRRFRSCRNDRGFNKDRKFECSKSN